MKSHSPSPAILVVCTSPVIQKTLLLDSFYEGEVVRCADQRSDPAGKGFNCGRILVQNGLSPVVLSTVGGSTGPILKSLVERDEIPVEWVETEGEVRYCYTLLDRERGTTTELVEEARPVTEEEARRLKDTYEGLLLGIGSQGTVVIAGSKPKGFSDDIYPWMVARAKEEGLRVVLDMRKGDLLGSLPHRPDGIKPNFVEFGTTFFDDFASTEGEEAEEDMDPVRDKMLELYREYGTTSIISRGKRPTLYVENGSIKTMEPESIEPLNTVGCGDAMTAGIASVIARGGVPGEEEGLISRAVETGHEWARLNALQLPPGSIRPGR
ncbi:MAG: 1-phosphofructokinase family hexose kinase [Spirochaetia bacterium]